MGLAFPPSPLSLWLEIAAREQLVIIAPDAGKKGWSDCSASKARVARKDDVGFIDDLLTYAIAQHNVDPDRVYLIGVSRGGWMAYRLATEIPHRLAAFSVVFAGMPPPGPSALPTTPLSVALAPGQREDQAVAKAARDQIGMAPGDAVVDYYHIRSADADAGERQVLLAVAERARVAAFLDVLNGAGLDPVALDIGPAAMARLLAAMQAEDLGQAVLLINFGVKKSYLTVTWGRRLMLDREIDFGEAVLAEKLASGLGLSAEAALGLLRRHGVGARPAHSEAEAQPDVGRTIREILYPEFAALAEELVRTQVYIASRTRGSTVSRVYLNGSLAGHPDIVGRIGELVSLPVEVLDPLSAFAPGTAPASLGQHPGIALAVGLALRGEPLVGN